MSLHLSNQSRPLVLLAVGAEKRRDMLAYSMRTNGNDSIAAHSAREAMILCEKARPDILIIASGLSWWDGSAADILQWIQKSILQPPIVIVLESKERPMSVEDRSRLGVNVYLEDHRVTPAQIVDEVKEWSRKIDAQSAAKQ